MRASQEGILKEEEEGDRAWAPTVLDTGAMGGEGRGPRWRQTPFTVPGGHSMSLSSALPAAEGVHIGLGPDLWNVRVKGLVLGCRGKPCISLGSQQFKVGKYELK